MTALDRILAARAAQVDIHGHSSASDDAIGAHALTHMARQRILSAEQRLLADISRETGDALDMLRGNHDRAARIDARSAAALDQCLAKAAALIIAAMETFERARAAGSAPGGQQDEAA